MLPEIVEGGAFDNIENKFRPSQTSNNQWSEMYVARFMTVHNITITI